MNDGLAKTDTGPRGPRLIAAAVLFALLMLFVFSLTLKPLADPDIWWHMKVGQWMVENKSLLGKDDPFSYTTPKPVPDRQVDALRNQWLGQVVFYLAYAIGGLPGVAVFRGLLIVIPLVYLFFRFVKRGLDPLLALGLFIMPALLPATALTIQYERPQAFSFVLALFVVVLLEGLKEREAGGKKTMLISVLLPLSMALWSNLHGGHIVGVIIILIYASGEVFDLVTDRIRGKTGTADVRFLAVCLVSVISSFLNPAFHRPFAKYVLSPFYLLKAGRQTDRPSFIEYKSTFFFYTELGNYWALYVMGFLLAGFAALGLKLISERRMSAARLLAFAFAGFIGFYYSRAIEFAMLIMTFYVGEFFLATRKSFRIAVSLAFSLVGAAFFVNVALVNPANLTPSYPASWTSPIYPEKALGFLTDFGVEGPIYNYFTWGGYIMWKAHPRYKVFIDGRSISGGMSMTASSVFNGKTGWQGILDAYDVNVVLIPLVSEEVGLVSGLALDVAKDKSPEWKPVYLVENTAVFLRDNEKNRYIINRYRLPPALILKEALWITEVLMKDSPGNRNLRLSKAMILYNLERYAEAERAIEGVVHPLADRLRGLIKSKGS